MTSVLSPRMPSGTRRSTAACAAPWETGMERPHSSFSTMTSYSWPFFWPSRRGGPSPAAPAPCTPGGRRPAGWAAQRWTGGGGRHGDPHLVETPRRHPRRRPVGAGEEPGSCPGPAPPLPHRRRPPPCLRPHRPNLFGGAAPAGGGQHPLLGPAGGHLRPHPPSGQRRDRRPPGPMGWSRSSTIWDGGSTWPTPGTTWPKTERRGNYNPPWPGTATRRRRRRPPPGNHARLPGPWPKPLFFSAGLGPVGRAAGAHPIHRLAGGGGGSVYRPVEERNRPFHHHQGAALPADPRDKENNSL